MASYLDDEEDPRAQLEEEIETVPVPTYAPQREEESAPSYVGLPEIQNGPAPVQYPGMPEIINQAPPNQQQPNYFGGQDPFADDGMRAVIRPGFHHQDSPQARIMMMREAARAQAMGQIAIFGAQEQMRMQRITNAVSAVRDNPHLPEDVRQELMLGLQTEYGNLRVMQQQSQRQHMATQDRLLNTQIQMITQAEARRARFEATHLQDRIRTVTDPATGRPATFLVTDPNGTIQPFNPNAGQMLQPAQELAVMRFAITAVDRELNDATRNGGGALPNNETADAFRFRRVNEVRRDMGLPALQQGQMHEFGLAGNAQGQAAPPITPEQMTRAEAQARARVSAQNNGQVQGEEGRRAVMRETNQIVGLQAPAFIDPDNATLPPVQRAVVQNLDRVGATIDRIVTNNPDTVPPNARATYQRFRQLLLDYGSFDAMPPNVRAEVIALRTRLNGWLQGTNMNLTPVPGAVQAPPLVGPPRPQGAQARPTFGQTFNQTLGGAFGGGGLGGGGP